MEIKKKPGYVLFIILIVFLFSCAPVKLYEGPERPEQEIAILTSESHDAPGSIYRVDDKKIRQTGLIHLLPGTHSFMITMMTGGTWKGVFSKADLGPIGYKHYYFDNYIFKAGHKYVVKKIRDINHLNKIFVNVNYRIGLNEAGIEDWWNQCVKPEYLGELRLMQPWPRVCWYVIYDDLEKVKRELAVHPELLQKIFTVKWAAKGNDYSYNPKHYEYKITLLHLAVMSRNPQVIEYLLNKGMDVNLTTTEYEWTQLHMFAIKRYFKNIKAQLTENKIIHKLNLKTLNLLLEHGMQIDVKDKYDRTPLHRACEFEQLDAVKILHEKGADLNTKGIYGWTPLHTAADRGNLEIVKYLVKNGADPDAKTEAGKTPIDVTRKNSILWYLTHLDED